MILVDQEMVAGNIPKSTIARRLHLHVSSLVEDARPVLGTTHDGHPISVANLDISMARCRRTSTFRRG